MSKSTQIFLKIILVFMGVAFVVAPVYYWQHGIVKEQQRLIDQFYMDCFHLGQET